MIAGNSFDDKMFDFVKNVDVDFTEIEDAITDIKNTITLIKSEMYPIGVVIKSSSMNPPTTGKWKLVGLYGTYTYEDEGKFSHTITLTGSHVEDSVVIKSFTYENGLSELEGLSEPNDRKYGTSILSWSSILSSNNYSIDYIKTASTYNSLINQGFTVWVSGVAEAEWGIQKIDGNQDYVEWFTYAPDKGSTDCYSATFRLTLNDPDKIDDRCKSSMTYYEYQRVE